MSKENNKLPKNAELVFKGVIFDVWQWKQKMFDGSTAVFEKLKRADTVNIIAVSEKKIVMISQKQPDWKKFRNTLAGGRVEPGETPLEAAKRELLEETGYASKDWQLWMTMVPYEKIDWTIFNFIARDCIKKQKEEPDCGEKIKLRQVTFDEFLAVADDPDFYEGEIKYILYRARYDQRYRRKFKALLFGK